MCHGKYSQGAQNFLKHFRRTQNYRLGEFKILSRRIQVCKFLPRFARFLRCCPVFILMEMPFCPKAGHFLPCFKNLPSNVYLYFLFTIFFHPFFYNIFFFLALAAALFHIKYIIRVSMRTPGHKCQFICHFLFIYFDIHLYSMFFSLYELLYFD